MVGIATVQAPPQRIEDTYADHTRAVEAACAGRYDEGLTVLRGLLQYFLNDYPLNRDFVVISTWKNDRAGTLPDVTPEETARVAGLDTGVMRGIYGRGRLVVDFDHLDRLVIVEGRTNGARGRRVGRAL